MDGISRALGGITIARFSNIAIAISSAADMALVLELISRTSLAITVTILSHIAISV